MRLKKVVMIYVKLNKGISPNLTELASQSQTKAARPLLNRSNVTFNPMCDIYILTINMDK